MNQTGNGFFGPKVTYLAFMITYKRKKNKWLIITVFYSVPGVPCGEKWNKWRQSVNLFRDRTGAVPLGFNSKVTGSKMLIPLFFQLVDF